MCAQVVARSAVLQDVHLFFPFTITGSCYGALTLGSTKACFARRVTILSCRHWAGACASGSTSRDANDMSQGPLATKIKPSASFRALLRSQCSALHRGSCARSGNLHHINDTTPALLARVYEDGATEFSHT